MKTNIVFSDYYKPYFTNKSVKIPLNFLLGKNVHLSKMAAEKEGELRARVVTWQATSQGVAVKDFKGPDKHNVVSRITHLAKLNP